MLAYAHKVVFVPGYGLAVAQAQHDVRQLADLLEAKGVEVVVRDPPGRRPHAGPHERAARRGERPVHAAQGDGRRERRSSRAPTSPSSSARTTSSIPTRAATQSSPIYGMPILDVDNSQTVVVLKRSMNPGFAGIENPLFYNPKTVMLFGDAKQSIMKLIQDVKTPVGVVPDGRRSRPVGHSRHERTGALRVEVRQHRERRRGDRARAPGIDPDPPRDGRATSTTARRRSAGSGCSSSAGRRTATGSACC